MNIKKARKEAGITQQELAERIGVNRATISKYESGQISIPFSQVLAIIKALDISPEHFFGVLDAPMLDDVTDPKKAAEEYMEAIRNTRYARAAEFSASRYGFNIINSFRLLNEEGKQEAAKRVHELCFIPAYCLDEASTTSEDTPEAPTEPE